MNSKQIESINIGSIDIDSKQLFESIEAIKTIIGSKMLPLLVPSLTYGINILKIISESYVKKLWLCKNCHSDNVQEKMWVNINEGNSVEQCTDGSEDDYYCNDCASHTDLYLITLNKDVEKIGYQVISDTGDNKLHPDIDSSKCIYSLSQAHAMLDDEKNECQYKLITIWEGDIVNPVQMFSGKFR